MPYRVLVCKLCDTLVQSASAHGNEDEHCEGDDGYEFINLWTDREVADGRAVPPPAEPPKACPTCGGLSTIASVAARVRAGGPTTTKEER